MWKKDLDQFPAILTEGAWSIHSVCTMLEGDTFSDRESNCLSKVLIKTLNHGINYVKKENGQKLLSNKMFFR